MINNIIKLGIITNHEWVFSASTAVDDLRFADITYHVCFRFRPCLGLVDQPIFLFVPDEARPAWLDKFLELVSDPKNLFVLFSAFVREQVRWQTGVALPLVRHHALRTFAAASSPGRDGRGVVYGGRGRGSAAASVATDDGAADEVMYVGLAHHRPHFLPLIRLFHKVNADHIPSPSLVFLDLSDIPEWRSGASSRYEALARRRAAVVWPYDVHFVKFLELYSLEMPMLVPVDWPMWAFTWTISNPDCMDAKLSARARFADLSSSSFGGEDERTWDHPYPPWCAESRLRHLHPTRCLYWAAYSDFARLPHLVYFRNLAHLFDMLYGNEMDVEALQKIRQRMHTFNARTLIESEGFWRAAARQLLFRNTSEFYPRSLR